MAPGHPKGETARLQFEHRLRERLMPPAFDPELPEGYRPAAVLVLLRDGPQGPEVFLTTRKDDLSRHAGQISCPGGSRDAQDGDAAVTALREAYEEVGLQPHAVSVLGRMDTVSVRISRYAVAPVVGWLCGPFEPCMNPAEVADTFWQPLRELSRVRRLDSENPTRPEFPLLDHRIWGATARILGLLLDLLDEQ